MGGGLGEWKTNRNTGIFFDEDHIKYIGKISDGKPNGFGRTYYPSGNLRSALALIDAVE